MWNSLAAVELDRPPAIVLIIVVAELLSASLAVELSMLASRIYLLVIACTVLISSSAACENTFM